MAVALAISDHPPRPDRTQSFTPQNAGQAGKVANSAYDKEGKGVGPSGQCWLHLPSCVAPGESLNFSGLSSKCRCESN